MNPSTTANLFAPASKSTIELIKNLNENETCTFFTPAFISEKAGQLGFLFNEYFNLDRGTDQPVKYRTFFLNSRLEALHGAIKLARIRADRINKNNNKTILFYSSNQQLKIMFDPLDRGMKEALVPKIRFIDDRKEAETFISKRATFPAAVVIPAYENIQPDEAGQLVMLCKQHHVLSILDLSFTDFKVSPAFIHQVSPLPDMVVVDENPAGNEIPFGAFSVVEAAYTPWNNLVRAVDHLSTGGGNRLALTRVCDYLLNNVPEFVSNSSVKNRYDQIASGEIHQRKAYGSYCHRALLSLFKMTGTGIFPVKAHGSTLTVIEKSREKKYIDCLAGGGLGLRGHTPKDIVPEVLELHNHQQDYWAQLCEKLTHLTGYPHIFPAVSGSTAVDIAIQLALLANKDKTRIIVFSGNYSGITLVSLIGTAKEKLRLPYFPLYFDVVYIDPFAKDAEDVITKELKSEKIALIWFEILQGQNGRVLPRKILDLIRQYREKSGYLIGVDEIMTGLYRTGKFFAHTGRIDSPDMVTLFKGLTDCTFPFGVTLVSPGVHERAAANYPDLVNYLENLYINQLGAHIALHLLEKLDSPQFQEHLRPTAEIFAAGLDEIAKNSPFVKRVRGEGFFYCIHYNYRSILLNLLGPKAQPMIKELFPVFMSRTIARKTNIILALDRLMPALTITGEQTHSLLRKLKKQLTSFSGRLSIHLGFHIFLYKLIRYLKKSKKRKK